MKNFVSGHLQKFFPEILQIFYLAKVSNICPNYVWRGFATAAKTGTALTNGIFKRKLAFCKQFLNKFWQQSKKLQAADCQLGNQHKVIPVKQWLTKILIFLKTIKYLQKTITDNNLFIQTTSENRQSLEVVDE